MFQSQSQQESAYKCRRMYHDREYALYLCIKPGCMFQPICCQICVNEYHKNHLVEDFIPINELNQIQSLNLKQIYEQLQQFEKRINSAVKEMTSILSEIDFVKRIEEQPSIELLKMISQFMKNKRNYKELTDTVNRNVNEVNHILDQMNEKFKVYMEQKTEYADLNVQQRYEKGFNLYMEGNYEQGIIWFDRALEIDCEHKEALVTKAESLRMLDRYEEAIQYADLAIAIDPKYKQALVTKAESLRMLDRYEEAIQYADLAIAIDLNYKQALYTKAATLMMLKRYEEAIQCADQVIAIDPKYKQALVTKADSLMMLDRYEEAIQYANQVIAIDPNYAVALATKGSALRQINKLQDALTCINRALEINPNDQFAKNEKQLILQALQH